MLYTIHMKIDVDVAMPVEDKSKSLLPFLSSPKLLPNESEAEFQSGDSKACFVGPRSVPIPNRNCRDVVKDLRHLRPLLVLFYVG
jgi:hypothetical protein